MNQPVSKFWRYSLIALNYRDNMANLNERAELHKTIWKIANDLRGSVDGWEFKAYVLGSIFYRFISENIC